MDANIININVLKRIDPSISYIVDTTSYVVLYRFSQNKWAKTGQEGTLFIFQREEPPFFGVLVLNRTGLDNFCEPLRPGWDVDLDEGLVIWRNENATGDKIDDIIHGIWVYEADHRERLTECMQKLIATSDNSPQTPGREPTPAPPPPPSISHPVPRVPIIHPGQSFTVDDLFSMHASSTTTIAEPPPPLQALPLPAGSVAGDIGPAGQRDDFVRSPEPDELPRGMQLLDNLFQKAAFNKGGASGPVPSSGRDRGDVERSGPVSPPTGQQEQSGGRQRRRSSSAGDEPMYQPASYQPLPAPTQSGAGHGQSYATSGPGSASGGGSGGGRGASQSRRSSGSSSHGREHAEREKRTLAATTGQSQGQPDPEEGRRRILDMIGHPGGQQPQQQGSPGSGGYGGGGGGYASQSQGSQQPQQYGPISPPSQQGPAQPYGQSPGGGGYVQSSQSGPPSGGGYVGSPPGPKYGSSPQQQGPYGPPPPQQGSYGQPPQQQQQIHQFQQHQGSSPHQRQTPPQHLQQQHPFPLQQQHPHGSLPSQISQPSSGGGASQQFYGPVTNSQHANQQAPMAEPGSPGGQQRRHPMAWPMGVNEMVRGGDVPKRALSPLNPLHGAKNGYTNGKMAQMGYYQPVPATSGSLSGGGGGTYGSGSPSGGGQGGQQYVLQQSQGGQPTFPPQVNDSSRPRGASTGSQGSTGGSSGARGAPGSSIGLVSPKNAVDALDDAIIGLALPLADGVLSMEKREFKDLVVGLLQSNPHFVDAVYAGYLKRCAHERL